MKCVQKAGREVLKFVGRVVVDSAFLKSEYPFLFKSAQDYLDAAEEAEQFIQFRQATSARHQIHKQPSEETCLSMQFSANERHFSLRRARRIKDNVHNHCASPQHSNSFSWNQSHSQHLHATFEYRFQLLRIKLL